jgi:hypothetical protein
MSGALAFLGWAHGQYLKLQLGGLGVLKRLGMGLGFWQ